MPLVLLGVRLLLSAVFAAAAIGKLRDVRGFRRTLGEFGAPAPTISFLGVLIPAVELIAAVFLISATSAQGTMWGAALSLCLFITFTAAVAINLSKGHMPDCRCFGQIRATPIGFATLVRNLVLASCAALLLVMGPGLTLGAALERWNDASTGERLVWLGVVAVVVLLGFFAELASRLRSQNQQLRERLQTLERQLATASPSDGTAGLSVGTPAPAFDLPLLAGDQASLAALTAAGTPLLLIFSSSHCSACGELWRDIARWQRDYAARLRIAVIGSGSAQVIETKLIGFEVHDVLLADDATLSDAYRLPGIPAAVVVGPDGTIDSETVMGPVAIRDLVRRRGSLGRDSALPLTP